MNKRQRKKRDRPTRNRFAHLKHEFKDWIAGKTRLRVSTVYSDGRRTVRYMTHAEYMATTQEKRA